MWLFLQHRHDSVLTMWLHDLYRTRRPTQNLPPFWGLQLATATFSLYSVITTRSLPTDELMLSQAVMSQTLVISSPPPSTRRPRSIAMNMSVCLSVRSHISKTTCQNFTKFSVHVTCGRLLTTTQYVMYFRFCGWRHVFIHNGPNTDAELESAT